MKNINDTTASLNECMVTRILTANIKILTATIKFIKDTERFDKPLY